VQRYIPELGNFRKYYRHLLLGPFVIYQAHLSRIEVARCLLVGPVHRINDVVEQLASRLEWVSNPTVMGVATRLYVDREQETYKKGAGGKGPGSPRRLSDILDQFDLTYDLAGMEIDDLYQLLPTEFNTFKK